MNLIDEARSLATAQRYSEALDLAAEAVRRDPDNGDVLVGASRVFAEARQFKRAASLLSTVVRGLTRLNRKVPWQVAFMLADHLRRSGDPRQADKLLSKLLETGVERDEFLIASALVAIDQDDGARARAQLERVRTDSEHARFARGYLLEFEGDVQAARALWFLNVDTPTPHLETLDRWINTFDKAHDAETLREALTDLSARHPDCLEFVYALAAVCHASGEFNAALDAYERAVEISPHNTRVLHELAILYRLAGRIDASMDLVSRALDLNPNIPKALRTFGMEHKYSVGQRELDRLLRVGAHYADFTEEDQVHLHFALGKAYEDIGHLDVGFEHYAVGGQKRQAVVPYSRAKSARSFSMLTKHVTASAIDASGEVGSSDATPVFILGMPRSGTSLLEQIISSHPDAFGTGELKYIGRVIQNMIVDSKAINIGEAAPLFQKDDMVGWSRRGDEFVRYLRTLAPDAATRIVDKMPGNFNYVGLIHALLPQATIIHSQRHPVDTCLSNYRILFSEGQGWSYNLSDMAHYYRNYWNLMEFWRQEFPAAMTEVFYEKVIADTEAESRRVISALGLEWSDACLEFHKTERVVKTASTAQVRKPIYQSSAFRWKKYEDQMRPLIEELADIIEVYESRLSDVMKLRSVT